MKLINVMLIIFYLICLYTQVIYSEIVPKHPSVQIVTLFRNKAHTLPYFFSYLEKLDYPKNRISLWFRSDHNEDNTIEIIQTWLTTASDLYHNVNFEYKKEAKRRINEISATHWPEARHLDVIRYKEEAFNYARQTWADFVFFLDADVFLTEPITLQRLVYAQQTVVAPMLMSDGLYSNFWCGMTDEFYYKRTDEYKQIYQYEKVGEFQVPMVHSAVIINLKDSRSDFLTFNRTVLQQQQLELHEDQLIPSTVPIDDIIIFSLSANYSDIPLYISNAEIYGYILVPLDADEPIIKDMDQLINIKIIILNDVAQGLVVNKELAKYVTRPEKDTMTLSKIFMINLVRRSERRIKMEQSFDELGLKVDDFPAVDGLELNDESLEDIGVTFLSGYADPYHNRPMTLGEIGCFLSHYYIWQTMVDMDLEEVLVLEDDIRFEPYFKERATNILNEARYIGGWDLIYLGRKRLENRDEQWIGDSEHLVKAGYSYWTLGYLLTLKGAKKLLDEKPLQKLLPVDEYLPIMFDQHANTSWKNAFINRNLVAWSAAPLILFPTFYTGEDGYISDTEYSVIVAPDEELGGKKKEKKGNKENYIENLISDDNKMLLAEEQLKNDLLIDTVADSLADTLSLKTQHTEL